MVKNNGETHFIFLRSFLSGDLVNSDLKLVSFRSGELSAVKVVKLEAGDNFAVIQQEILMIRGCSHPNIIAVGILPSCIWLLTRLF